MTKNARRTGRAWWSGGPLTGCRKAGSIVAGWRGPWLGGAVGGGRGRLLSGRQAGKVIA